MHTLDVRNVNEALPLGIAYLQRQGAWEDTRAGRALVAPCPVATVYSHPRERVLFSPLRDANPFFHLAESMWMLAGRRDAAFLNNFVRDFGARFAEDDGTIHDAYGYRWRHAFGFDQLDAVVKQLSNTPGSRQAVISMWDPTATHEVVQDKLGVGSAFQDVVTGGDDLRGTFATRPCNVAAFLRIRNEPDSTMHDGGSVLDITVCCRSNDIVWGAYGANAVQFSILQEYLAARLDVGVGTYTQFSNNYHIYEDQYDKLNAYKPGNKLWDDRYTNEGLELQPLVHDVESFDREVSIILAWYEHGQGYLNLAEFHNLFLSRTVWQMLMCHTAWKKKAYGDALTWCRAIVAPDWRIAATEWIERRIK